MQILGFYDSIPATDKKAFTAGFVEMLAVYPPAVLDRAISPSRGIAAYIAYPNLAKFRELLEQWHADHIDDLRRRGELRKNRDGSSVRLLPPPDADVPPVPGDLANVHVPTSNVRYAGLVEWAKTAEPRLWRFGKSSDGVAGIWVALDVWDERAVPMRPIADVVKSFTLSESARRSMRQSDENKQAAE